MWIHTLVYVVCGHGHTCPNNQAPTSPCFWNHSDLSQLWDQWVGRPPKGKPEGTPGAQERPQRWLDRESQASAPAQGQRRRAGMKGGHHFFSQRRFTYWEGTWLKGGPCRDPPTHRLRIAPKILVTLQVCAPKGQHKQNWFHLPPPHIHKFQIITAFCAEKSKFSGAKFTSPMTSWWLPPGPLQFLQTTPARKL